MLTGMTANEYIRNRRLSMAGQDISMSSIKVIDVALKYGYDSPESFTKAFTRFQGVTPNVARRAGMKLKSFNRLTIKLKLEGGTTMDYRIEKRDPFSGECIGDVWQRIFSEFLPNSDYTMLDDTDFELYAESEDNDCFCEIWIPVEKKEMG